ncbi:MAG: potassium transporter TrkG, partial [Bacteroidales bacterium]
MTKVIHKGAFIVGAVGMMLVLFDFGFEQSAKTQKTLDNLLILLLSMGLFSLLARYAFKPLTIKLTVLLFDAASMLFIAVVIMAQIISPEHYYYLFNLHNDVWIGLAMVLIFVREVSVLNLDYKRATLNPAQLFITSFFSIILIGTLILLLPNATHSGISFIDALFTSTSAVCVTGLIVVDTGSYFTLFGQIVILILIQLGGLGILTFASYFSYFFKGGSTYENQLVIGNMTNMEKLGEVFTTLKRILVTTFSIELAGAFMIYATLDKSQVTTFFERSFFSVFHSVSAFCNAGFSTLQNSLYEEGFRFNYSLQLVIISLVIIGGLGFPIVFNILKYIKYLAIQHLLKPARQESKNIPWVLNINSRITLITTLVLLVAGTLLFYLTEYQNTLAGHHGIGKLVVAFFSAATPRTAGFNTVETGLLHFNTLLIIMFLMWIGASPGSTGGGIKTSTFAIAILNIISLAKGKSRIEVYRREIANVS